MSPAEREYLERHGAERHARTARLIDDLTHYSAGKRCECDVGRCCRFCRVVTRIVERAHRTGKTARLDAAVGRFVRRVSR